MATRLEALLEEADAASDGLSFVRPLGSKRHSDAPAPRIHRVDALLLRKFEPIRWAIRDMVPEGVTLLVGPPKIGKSWLTLQLAIAIASGDRVWKGRAPEDAGDVLMLGLEDNDRRIQSRVRKLQAATAELEMIGGFVEGVRTSDVSRMHYATEWPRMNQGGVDFIAEWLVKHPHARLVIIDTLAKFRPPESGKASAYAADYEVGAALKPLADRFNVAILLVHHTRKMSATDVLDTVSGTQGLTGSVDALLLLRRERGSMDAALYITGRDIEREEDYALQFHSESCTWSALGSMHTVARTRERQAIVDFLQSNGPSKPKDIAEGLGKKGSAIRRLLQKLFADGALRLEDGKYALPLIHSSGKPANWLKGNLMFTRWTRSLACLVLAFVSQQVCGSVQLQSFGISSGVGTQLFTTVGAQTTPGAGTSATAEAAWPVTINFALMDTLPASVEVNFPDRVHATLTKTLGESRVGGWIWTGQGHGCFAVFSRFASVLRGTLSCGSAPYAIAHTPGTTAQFLTRHSGSGMTTAQEELPSAPPGTPPWAPQTTCTGPDTTVDVLVVFSADYAPLGASIWEDAQFAIDLVRGIMHNSLSTVNIRLAGAARISRSGPGYPPVDLDDLPLDSQVLALRNYWAGDVVMYLASGSAFQAAGVLGAANIPQNQGMPPPGPQFADLAFAALLGDYATDPGFYTFAHEFGHTFGANHARGDDAPNPDNPTPVEPWAFGRWAAMTRQQAQKNRYGAHDIMAYMNQCVAVVLNNDPDNCQMVPFYSNPLVTVTTEYLMDDGHQWTFTTGAPHNGGNPADNAAVISEFAVCSAQYRARTDRIFADPFE